MFGFDDLREPIFEYELIAHVKVFNSMKFNVMYLKSQIDCQSGFVSDMQSILNVSM